MERREMPVSTKPAVKKPESQKVALTQEQLDMQRYLGAEFVPLAEKPKPK